jgi:hypothetical protein
MLDPEEFEQRFADWTPMPHRIVDIMYKALMVWGKVEIVLRDG